MNRSTRLPAWAPSAAIALGVAVLVTPVLRAQSLVFQNGWENRSELGCTLFGLLDGTGGSSSTSWNDFGPRFDVTCGSNPPVAEIVTNERHDGNRALQVNFEPIASQLNGPDFRIAQGFGGARSEIYARWYVKYSSNWRWASADHKIAIFGDTSGSQDVYFNIRGNGNGGNGRVVIHVIPADTLFEDTSTNMSPGVWHLCEIHIVSGSNGRVEAKLDGRLLNLTGSQNPNNVRTGNNVGYMKLDTTYNAYSYPASLGLHMQMWYDTVAASIGGWIGGTGGETPPIPAPTAPLNVRVIR